MTKNKAFKRFVRRRAADAGESYQRMREHLGRDIAARDVRSEEDRQRGRRLADLALRAADGKPVVFSRMPPEVVELTRALYQARKEALDPGAAASCRDRADELEAELDRASAEAARVAESISVEDYLARVVGREVAALAVAQRICRDALDFNPRDVVARDALALLERVERAPVP